MVTSKKTMKVRLGFVLYRNRETSLEDSAPIEGFLSVWGFNGEQQRSVVATGGCGCWRRSLGCWGRVLEERRRKEWLFSKVTRKIRLETLKCFCSREKKSFSHTRRHITDHNGQFMDICPMNLQTKFRKDPTVNECRRALLPRWLQASSLRSFLVRLLCEASLRGFFEKLKS